MSPAEQKELAELIAETDAIETAVQLAVIDALNEHKRAGNAVVGWEDGRLIVVQPDQIDIEALAKIANAPRGPKS